MQAVTGQAWVRWGLKLGTSALIIAAGGVTLFVFGQRPEINTREVDERFAAVLVDTVEVVPYTDPVVISIHGEAANFRVVDVAAEVSGRIDYKLSSGRSGQFVKAGERLFEIDRESYRIEVEQQQAELEQIDQELRAVLVELENLSTLILLAEEEQKLQRDHLERTRRLYERNATFESEFDSVKTLELAARNALQRLKNQFATQQQARLTTQARRKVTEAALKRAELNLARCQIRAPIDGRVLQDDAEEGKFVSAGTVLTRLSDASRMEVRTQLTNSELVWIWEQQLQSRSELTALALGEDPIELLPVPCEVVFTMGGIETVWQGELTRFDGTGLNRETRTFPVRVVVANPHVTTVRQQAGNGSGSNQPSITPPTLVAGMYVKVQIPIELRAPLLALPIEAVRPGGKVWVNDEGALKIVDAPVARQSAGLALIRPESGLKAGDRVVMTPLAAVTTGMKLREQESHSETPRQAVEEQEPVQADALNLSRTQR